MPKADFSPELAKAVHDRLLEIWQAHDLDPQFFMAFSLDAAYPLWMGEAIVCTYEDGALILDFDYDGEDDNNPHFGESDESV